MAKLKEVCIINPKSPGFPDDLKVSFVPMPKVGENGEFNPSDVKEYREVKKGFTYFQNGDVLFAKITPCMENGKGAIANGMKNGVGFGSTEFHVLRPLTDYVSDKWLFYLLSWPIFRKDAEKNMTGSAGQKRVPKSFLEEYALTIPSIEEQQEMTDALDKVSNLISLRKGQLAKLDELVKARFVELFGATSADKCSKQIKDYAEVLGGYAFKSDMFCTNAVPVIRISNINNGCVDPDYDVCYDELFWEQNKRFRAEQNDILMAMSGATTGKAGLYKEDMPALINQRVACIRAKDGIACPMFLFVATQLEWMYDLIQETSAGCAQPNISGKQIENMPVPDATYEQQQQFAAFVEQTDKSKLAIQQSLDKLETLKRSLMQKYFG
ncbi:MAG: restriction endonuclease subunit S [Oscillospiraceae bacterium]|nr:restriction endonuclease subunit S [Oscillospiraceae bacterium]